MVSAMKNAELWMMNGTQRERIEIETEKGKGGRPPSPVAVCSRAHHSAFSISFREGITHV
jgi:hypothetical protein